MERKVFMLEQHKVLDRFYKAYFAKHSEHTIYWFMAGFCLFLLGIMVCIPYQVLGGDEVVSIVVSVAAGTGSAVSYIHAYQYCEHTAGKVISFRSRLKYMPVSGLALYTYQMKKVLKFQVKVYAVLQVAQLFFSIVCLHEVVWGNVWYPVVVVFLIPVFSVGLFSLVKK